MFSLIKYAAQSYLGQDVGGLIYKIYSDIYIDLFRHAWGEDIVTLTNKSPIKLCTLIHDDVERYCSLCNEYTDERVYLSVGGEECCSRCHACFDKSFGIMFDFYARHDE